MRNITAARTIQITCIGIGVTGMIACGDDDRLRSEDVKFPDLALQQCFDEQQTTILGRPYADQISILRCSFTEISSLEGIDVLSSLVELDLRENPRLEISEVILELPMLEMIDLTNSNQDDSSVQVLSQLRTPVYLELSLNNLGDIGKLADNQNITGLIADAAGITGGVRELARLEKATVISLYGNPESSCIDLDYLRINASETTTVVPLPDETMPGTDCRQ